MQSRVWVRSGGTLQTVIESFQELKWTRRYYHLGTLSLKVHRVIDGADVLLNSLGDEISIVDDPDSATPDLTYVIESIQLTNGPGGLAGDMVEVTAVEAGLFHQRVALPPPHELPFTASHHEITGDTETAMRGLVDNNIGPSAPAARQYPGLALDTNQNRGTTRTWQARFGTVAEKLAEWGELDGLGWEVQYDAGTDTHTFVVLEGSDKSASVEFSIKMDNITNQEWTENSADKASLALVAGQGEGVDRDMDLVHEGAEPTGTDRREFFVDARDIEDSGNLEQRGLEKLAERKVAESFTMDIEPEVAFQYRTDYDLGDTVTLKNSEWSLDKTKRIVEVENRITSGRVERRLTFGKAPKSLRSRITADIDSRASYVDANVLRINSSDDVEIYKATNDANPQIRIGSADADEGHIQAVYDSGAQTLDYLEIATDSGGEGDIVLTPTGNVGIGTTGPGAKLDINGGDILLSGQTTRRIYEEEGSRGHIQISNPFITGTVSGQNRPVVYGNNLYLDSSGSFQKGNDTIGGSAIIAGSSNGGTGGFSFVGLTDTDNSTVTTVDHVVINGNGNVGIGTTSPGATLDVNGSLSKNSGSFKIDHPLKEQTHNLIYSFIEGPNADLIYRGQARLERGQAKIDIDQHARQTAGTFEALCRDVQVFTSNEEGWEPVRGNVSGNTLIIQSRTPVNEDMVSWLVIGERKDKHMYETTWTDEDGRPIVERRKDEERQ